MERHFEQELDKLNRRVLKMGNLVTEQVSQSLEALMTGNVELAAKIIDNDNQVDELDVKIDKLCQRIFALTQPVATDLRFIMASLKINNDLERMGDHAAGIAKKVEGIADYRDILVELKIQDLVDLTNLVVKNAVLMLTTRRVVFARDIFETSALIKEKVQLISSRIIDEMMHKTDVIVVATNLAMILTQISRIAGYSKNIAESIVFLVEGKVVKHKRNFEKYEEPESDLPETE